MNRSACIDLSGREPSEAPDGRRAGHAPAKPGVALALLLCLAGAGQAAEKEPFLGQKSPRRGGSLVIVGGGLLPPAIRDRFLELGGGANARVVVIPTASRRAEVGHLEELGSYADWSRLAKSGRVKSFSFLHTRRSREANDPRFVKPLTEASAVWISGGDQSLLTDAYKGTAVEREVKNLLARGGVVGGTSAGAAVMSEIMIRGGNQAADLGIGFGLLPPGVVVDQHFGERKRLQRLLGVLDRHPECVGLGIDEQTGVVVQGERVTVVGNRNVRVCLPPPEPAESQVKILSSGTGVDLAKLHRQLNAATTAKARPIQGGDAKGH